jgi:tetratricopeptide (TPR) repeat protein
LALLAGDPAAAAALAGAALRLHPRWPDAHWWLGRRAAAAGDHPAAVAHLEAFVAVCPRHGAAQVELAFAQLAAGEHEAGLRRLGWALHGCFFTGRALAEVLGRLGRRALDLGQPDQAAAWLRDAVAACPGDGELHNLLGAALMATGELEEALRRLQTAGELGNAHAPSNTGVCLWRLGRRTDALRVWKSAVDRRPTDEAARRNLGAVLAAFRGATAGRG